MHFITAKHLLSPQNGMNLYRGCTHGCIYCDSRSTCYGFTHAFEDIEVKENAPALLEDALRRKRKRCMIGTGAMCDPYLPLERQLHLTRQCLEIIDRYGFGATFLTKSSDFLEDLPLLRSIHQKSKCVVQMTLTTYDESLCRILEPNVATTQQRFQALLRCRDAWIPTVVWLTPILPFLNDTIENLHGILDYCIQAQVTGIIAFGMGLTLRDGNREYFYAALDRHFPGMKQRYIQAYGNSYQLPSPNEKALMALFHQVCRAHGLLCTPEDCFSYLHALPDAYEQLSLF